MTPKKPPTVLAESREERASAAAGTRSVEAPSAEPGARTGLAREIAGHAPLVLASLAVLAIGSTALAVAWFVASRLAYVLFVGLSLRAESRSRALSRREGPEVAWRRFRDRAARLMFSDAVALGVLCIVTRGTLALPGGPWLPIAGGGVLIVLGVGIKLWATASLDAGTFYWRDFFVPAEERNFSVSGPYRWISNPMYSVGYAHAYGFALVLGSTPGLIGSLFAQVAIALLAVLVERPHVRRLER